MTSTTPATPKALEASNSPEKRTTNAPAPPQVAASTPMPRPRVAGAPVRETAETSGNKGDSGTTRAPEGRRVIWLGEAKRGTLLTISGSQASVGSVIGRLPGGPVSIEVFPAENGPQGLTIFTLDARYARSEKEQTPVGVATVAWDPRHATDLTIWSEPGPDNNWDKVVLRVNTPRLTACVIQWRRRTLD